MSKKGTHTCMTAFAWGSADQLAQRIDSVCDCIYLCLFNCTYVSLLAMPTNALTLPDRSSEKQPVLHRADDVSAVR